MSQLLITYWIFTGAGFAFIVGTSLLGHFHGSEELETQADSNLSTHHGDPGDVDSHSYDGDPGDVDGGDANVDGDTNHGARSSIIKELSMTTIERQRHDRMLHLYLQLIGFFSPTKFAIRLFFVGIFGVSTLLYFPNLGLYSLLPAIVLGYVISKLVLNTLAIMVTKLHSSTNFKQESLIGSTGRLTLSIEPGSLGEVLVSTRGSRHSAPARAVDPQAAMQNSTKVIVSDIKDGVFYVEPSP